MTADPRDSETALSMHREEASRAPDELVDALIVLWLQLDPATRIEVLSRFQGTLHVELGSQAARERLIASALHETRHALGRSPSLREYQAMRREHPGWMPHPRSITGWLGVRSWNDALVRLRLEPVLDGDEIEGAIGQTYSVEEVIRAVRDCAADLGRPPTVTDYLRWERQPEVRARRGRRPASTWVFLRFFGGFPQARVAAGMAEGEPTDAHPTASILRSASYRLTDEQVLADIREVAARTTGHLTATVYDRERHAIYLETRAEGRPRALAGVGTIYRYFGNWRAGMDAAGLDERTSPNPRASSFMVSREQIAQALRDAYDAEPGPLTVARYTEWRRQQNRALPSVSAINLHLGSWGAALQAAGIRVERVTRRGRYSLSNDHFFRALREAETATSGKLTVSRYASWREEEVTRDPARLRALPNPTTFYRRFGDLQKALEQMRDAAASL